MERLLWNPDSPAGRLWTVCNDAFDDPEAFVDALVLHALNGFVEATPYGIIMARPVDRYASRLMLADPSCVFSLDESNAWLVWGLSGEGMMPYFLTHPRYFPLQWIGFGRQGDDDFKFFKTEKITEKLLDHGQRARCKTT